MKKGFLIILILNLGSPVLAQQRKADSLATLLPLAKDTARVNLLNELTKSLWYYQLDKAAGYNVMALKLADSLSYAGGIAEAYRCKGVILSIRQDSTGLFFLEKALTMYRKLNNHRGIAATLNNQAGFYQRKGQFAKALEILEEALQLFTELHDQEAIGAITNQIGTIYYQQSNFSAALDYFLKALAIRRQIGDRPGEAFSLTRIGDLYAKLNKIPEALDYYQQAYRLTQTIGRNPNLINVTTAIGDIFKNQKKYPEALQYYNLTRKAEEAYYGKDSVNSAYLLIGQVYFSEKEYDLAIQNFQHALTIDAKSNFSRSDEIWYHLAEAYYEKGDYLLALEAGVKSMKIARENHNYNSTRNAGYILSRVYAALNDYPHAYAYQLQYDQAKDSVLNQDLNMRLASLQQSFEIKSRQTQIDLLSREKQLKESELNRQKQQRVAFIAVILLFLILATVLTVNNRQKQRTNRLLENTLSNLNATQAQLIQSEKMASLGELTAGIAHEIQNPLNFVNNFSDLNKELLAEMRNEIEKGTLDQVKMIAKDVMDNEDKINHHGKRADAIVKGMLQHSRINSGQKELTDINALCDEYLRLAYHGLRAKDKSFHAKFETRPDPALPKIPAVPQDLGRVLLNIFNNAFYAVNEKTKQGLAGYEPIVAVNTKKDKDKAEIRITDNGIGIPQNILDKIFQPFFTTRPTGQGTGLGLSISYDIVKAHGGVIKVNTKEGEGSEFIITLPAN